MICRKKVKKAQTAVEYLILMAAVVAVVLIGFKQYLPKVYDASNVFFNRAAVGIYGEPNSCGDGTCDWDFEGCESCPTDCC